MLTATVKGLLARKRRLLLTALAVTLAVSFMTGTKVLTDTIGKTFDDLFADVYRNTDVVVRAEAEFEGPMNTGDQRGRVDASLVDTVAAVDGVALAEGQVDGYARLVGKDGEAVGNPQNGAPTIGANWSPLPELNPFRIQSGGPPEAANDVVIDAKSAKDGDLPRSAGSPSSSPSRAPHSGWSSASSSAGRSSGRWPTRAWTRWPSRVSGSPSSWWLRPWQQSWWPSGPAGAPRS